MTLTADIKKNRQKGLSKNNDVGGRLVEIKEARRLRKALKRGIRTRNPSPNLASSIYMRQLRLSVIGAILQAVDPYADADLRLVTVISKQWRYDANSLNKVSAAAIKRQFRTHLERNGVFAIPGFLIGFLHGEFEPTSGKYQLHHHMLTTPQKADALAQLIGTLGMYRRKLALIPLSVTL